MSSLKCFTNPMKVEEIRGQKIITSFVPPEDSSKMEIFAKNIPQNLDENQVIPFFETVGPVHTLRLMMNKNNDANRGFAYLTYINSRDAASALKVLDGKEIIKNCPVTVTHSMNNCRIFLGGIPVKKTKDEVWQELEKRGITNIVDVIMYRSYNNRAQNRGFVFVEFPSHQYAAKMRNKMKCMTLWNNDVIVDWSVPEMVVPEENMKKVKILYLRNLNVMESKEYLKAIIEKYVNPQFVQKVYKFKNYAFVHLLSRDVAEELLGILKDHYRNTPVEVTFAKPASEYTKPEYRKQMLCKVANNDRTKSPTTSESSDYDRKVTIGQETRNRINNPLQNIENFEPAQPRQYRTSDPSSYFSTYEELISHKASSPPSLQTNFSFFPSKTNAEVVSNPMKWSDILKAEELNNENIHHNAIFDQAYSTPPNIPRSSHFLEGQKNTDVLGYSLFESELEWRKFQSRSGEVHESFESSPILKPKQLPGRKPTVTFSEEPRSKDKENMEFFWPFANTQAMNGNIWSNQSSNESRYSPWSTQHATQIETGLKPTSSIGNNPSSERRQYSGARQRLFGADITSITSSMDAISFDCGYINDLISDD